MDCTTEIGVVLQISPTNKLVLQNDLVRLVEQVFIFRNAKRCGFLGNFRATGVAFGDVIEVGRKCVRDVI